MSVLSKLPATAFMCGMALFASQVQAAIIVDLDPINAFADYTNGDAVNYLAPADFPAANRALGHTINATITPDAADLSGTTVIMEYGGTANGFNLGLVDGVLTYMAKHNSGDHLAPDSLNDTSLRPNGTSSGEAAVQSSAAALTAGVEYSVAVSWDQAGNLQLGVSDGNGTIKDAITLTGEFDNWSGNNTLGVGVGYQSFGGYSGELAANSVGSPWDVNETPVNAFSGTISDLQYWNASATIVPEPTAITLIACGLCAGGFNRRRRLK